MIRRQPEDDQEVVLDARTLSVDELQAVANARRVVPLDAPGGAPLEEVATYRIHGPFGWSFPQLTLEWGRSFATTLHVHRRIAATDRLVLERAP